MNENNFSISGKISGLKEGKISISYLNAEQLYLTHNINVSKTLFNYFGVINEPTLATFNYNNEHVSFFIEPNKEMYLTANIDSFSHASLQGSGTNNDMSKRHMMQSKKRIENEKLMTGENIRSIQFNVDTNFISSNPNSFYSLYLLNFYFSDLSYDFIKTIFEKSGIQNQNSSVGINIKKRLQNLEKILPGTILPDFEYSDEKNNKKIFKELISANKLILIDFGASWCIPCRQNNSFLKSLFFSYQQKGFTILSISIDENIDDWIQVIKSDSLNLWHNAIDNKEGL